MSRLFLSARNILSLPIARRPLTTTSPNPFRKRWFGGQNDPSPIKPAHHFRIDLPSLVVPTGSARLDGGFGIELVDHSLWPLSLAAAAASPPPQISVPVSNSVPDSSPDMDEIEDLRVRKRLFYKLDRDSKEFEEYNIDFHRKRKGRENPARPDLEKERKNPEKPIRSRIDPPPAVAEEKRAGARTRAPTFNQLTGPYHLPFCLDIHVTKGSVRACVVHRATSKVVAVAHSISKDLRFDVGSRKDARACAAVGAVLAQRAIEDDIHNVVYTPRRGDKIEGKLEVVLRSIIDNGIDVKVKLKQRRPAKNNRVISYHVHQGNRSSPWRLAIMALLVLRKNRLQSPVSEMKEPNVVQASVSEWKEAD